MTTPLPCPLCGKAPRVANFAGWEVLCKCGINFCLDKPEREPLIAAWNKRAAQPTMDSILNKALMNSGKKIEPPAQPDCRTCARYKQCDALWTRRNICTNGDKYQPAPKVVLWRTEP